jgi:hypothetical protein
MWRPARFIRLLIVPDIQLVDDCGQYCARPRRSLMAADPVPVGVSRLGVQSAVYAVLETAPSSVLKLRLDCPVIKVPAPDHFLG